jgi:prepilin-type N-terminal cleavage/methylation domain-containing protein
MRRERGFTLLEILVAIAIFAFVAGAAMQVMSSADYMAASGRRARDLRMLAERKMGEILTFEKHFDDNMDGDFDTDYPEYGDRFRDWKWNLDIRDVTVFGIATQEDAQYLFGEPSDEEKAAGTPAASSGSTGGGAAGGSGTTQKKGEPQQLREITLRVSSPAEDGAADSVEIISFAPLVNRKTAAGGK